MPALFAPSPPLCDTRVELRPWEDSDVAWLADRSRDPEVPRFTSVPPDNTEADVRAFLLAQRALLERGEQVHLLAVERETGERIGPVGLHRVDWRHRTAEIGYWAARAARGRGLTTAAARLVCRWAFGPLGLERVELRANETNAASQRVAEKLGFTREGVLRGAELRPDGRHALVVFGLLAGELTRR